MKDVMGIINLAEDEEHLRELTVHRSVGAIPFGGRYRLLDFILSNLVNAGIRNVAILAQLKFRSLIDHVGSGKEWDLDRQHEGLFMLPPAYTRRAMIINNGDVQNFHSNLDYIVTSRQKYVIVSGSAMICNIDFEDVLRFHQEKGADITVVYKEEPEGTSAQHCTVLETDEDGRLVDMEVCPRNIKTRKICTRMYVMERTLLIDLVDSLVSRGDTDFTKDGLIKNIDSLKIYGYPFDGYLGKITSLPSYYAHSMDLLRPEVWQELFFRHGPIYTKVKNEAPTQYRDTSRVKNSLIANGCIVEGTVENSILFRGVVIKKGAHIKNSIIMQKSTVEEDVLLEKVILDKDVRITRGKSLRGDENYPVVIDKRTVI